MKVFHSDAQAGHAPRCYAIGGEVVAARETPERIDALLTALRGAGHPVLAPRGHGIEPLRRLHTDDYLEFLRTAHARWRQAFPSGPRSEWVLPYAFPNRHMDARPGSVLGQAGWHLSSTTAPMRCSPASARPTRCAGRQATMRTPTWARASAT